jgi:hypothetical protein
VHDELLADVAAIAAAQRAAIQRRADAGAFRLSTPSALIVAQPSQSRYLK